MLLSKVTYNTYICQKKEIQYKSKCRCRATRQLTFQKINNQVFRLKSIEEEKLEFCFFYELSGCNRHFDISCLGQDWIQRDSVRVVQFDKRSRSQIVCSFVRSVEFPVAVKRIMECTVLRLTTSLVLILKRQHYNFNQTQQDGGVVDYWMFNILAR